MGKSPDDLNLSDEPLRRLEPVDPRDTEWYQFVQQIEELLEGGQFEWAASTLKGIAESVERYKIVTPGQRSAVANVSAARGRADGWRRRYEGHGGR